MPRTLTRHQHIPASLKNFVTTYYNFSASDLFNLRFKGISIAPVRIRTFTFHNVHARDCDISRTAPLIAREANHPAIENHKSFYRQRTTQSSRATSPAGSVRASFNIIYCYIRPRAPYGICPSYQLRFKVDSHMIVLKRMNLILQSRGKRIVS